jgi:transposase
MAHIGYDYVSTQNQPKGSAHSRMNSVTQNMKYRQSLIQYAEKYGVSRASRKYNKSRSYIYFWKARYDGTLESLADRSRRPHSHPNQHTEEELKLIRDMRRRNPKLGMLELWHRLHKRGYTRRPESLFRVMRKLGMFPPSKPHKPYKPKPYEQMQYPGQRIQIDVKVVPRACIADPKLRLYQYTAIDEYSRLRYLGAYEEQSTYSSADFLVKMVAWFKRRGVTVECVQTDNGFEFTNRFSSSKKDISTLFEKTAARLGIRHKLIRPYTPRHNGKVERSHREDQKHFYNTHRFYSLADFGKQLAIHQNRSNNLPMRPLHWLTPNEVIAGFNVQYV